MARSVGYMGAAGARRTGDCMSQAIQQRSEAAELSSPKLARRRSRVPGGSAAVDRHRMAKLRTELGYGSGGTCWRRMHEWAATGVFDRLHTAVLYRLGKQGRLDWSRASLDAVSVRAKGVS